ncbi:MAG: sigma-70 family RNA polymerase sigma factor [Bryobacterales bacterium]|nr:sigma-70 family RNA polymerase sigma factor [Bryobacterales bacterium]
MPDAEAQLLIPDVELLRRTAAGDQDSFSLLVDRHQDAVFRHACYCCAQRQDAEDVLQETFLAALRSAGQFRAEASCRTWLLRIARNAALRRRAGAAAVVNPEDSGALESLALRAGWGAANPESLALLAENHELLDRALAALPHDEREVLLLRHWEDLSGEDIAALLGLSLAAVKSRLHRARVRLAAKLREAQEVLPHASK